MLTSTIFLSNTYVIILDTLNSLFLDRKKADSSIFENIGEMF